jgi:hypothetical protein
MNRQREDVNRDFLYIVITRQGSVKYLLDISLNDSRSDSVDSKESQKLSPWITAAFARD